SGCTSGSEYAKCGIIPLASCAESAFADAGCYGHRRFTLFRQPVESVRHERRGGQEGNNEIIIDGASVVMARQRGSIAASPSGDAVEEFRVQTTLFDAAYGSTAGGVDSYSTRAGTKQLHGSFEGFLRNEVLEANGWTNNRNGLAPADIDRKF